jgi:acid stress chaperone HdeB
MVSSASKKEQIMRPKPIVTGLVFSSIVFATASTQAQVIVDVSKITCDQYVHAKITTPNYLAAWLSGYYNAKRNNSIIDLQTLEENVSKLQNYCYDEKNFKVPVMKAVEQVLGGRK